MRSGAGQAAAAGTECVRGTPWKGPLAGRQGGGSRQGGRVIVAHSLWEGEGGEGMGFLWVS